MNTDNMTISGETIDYGPCAYMDSYHPNTVFSSIDVNGDMHIKISLQFLYGIWQNLLNLFYLSSIKMKKNQ